MKRIQKERIQKAVLYMRLKSDVGADVELTSAAGIRLPTRVLGKCRPSAGFGWSGMDQSKSAARVKIAVLPQFMRIAPE